MSLNPKHPPGTRMSLPWVDPDPEHPPGTWTSLSQVTPSPECPAEGRDADIPTPACPPPSLPQAREVLRDPSTPLRMPNPPLAAGFGVSHRAWVPVGEGTGHNGESQSKSMKRKRGARPGRKETLHPQALPGIAAGTEGRLAADINIGGQLPWGCPGPPSHPTGTQQEEGTGSCWKSQMWMCYGKKGGGGGGGGGAGG